MEDEAVDEAQRKADAKKERQEKVKRLCQEMAMRRKIEKELREQEVREFNEAKLAYEVERTKVEAAQQAVLRQQQLADELQKLNVSGTQSRLNKDQERLRMRLAAREAARTTSS